MQLHKAAEQGLLARSLVSGHCVSSAVGQLAVHDIKPKYGCLTTDTAAVFRSPFLDSMSSTVNWHGAAQIADCRIGMLVRSHSSP